jgi:hypothetical protein
LRHEYRKTNLIFQTLSPGGVVTRQSVNGIGKRARSFYVNAIDYASWSFKTLGFSQHTCGHWYHSFEVIKIHINFLNILLKLAFVISNL